MAGARKGTYLGVDPSFTCTGVAVLRDGKLWTQADIKTPVKKPAGERLETIFDAILGLLRSARPVCVGVEGYAIAASFSPFMAGEVGGVVRLACAKASVPYFDVPPSLVKKFVTGNGQASKEHVKQAVFELIGAEPMSFDTSDALGMALVAEACDLGRSPRERRCEMEVVQTILHPKPKKKKKKAPFNL